MYYEEQDIFYYITLMNENYEMPILPMGSTEGICRGIYKLSTRDLGPKSAKVQLFGSGTILRESLRAQELLEKHFGVGSNVYSVTSYKSLYYDGRECDRWNRLHPTEPPQRAYVAQTLEGETGPVVAALDYVERGGAFHCPVGQYLPSPFGRGAGGEGFLLCCSRHRWLWRRSEARKELRRFFEIDAENIALAALVELPEQGKYANEKLPAAIKTLGLEPEKPNPVRI